MYSEFYQRATFKYSTPNYYYFWIKFISRNTVMIRGGFKMQEDSYEDKSIFTDKKEDNTLQVQKKSYIKSIGILTLASIVCVIIDCYLEQN